MKDLPLFGSDDNDDNPIYFTKAELFGKVSGGSPEKEESPKVQTQPHNAGANSSVTTAPKSGSNSSVPTVGSSRERIAPDETSRTPSSSSLLEQGVTFLGSNLHQLSDSHINKLVRLRFGGNPLQLIRQLLLDLAKKEGELILLRRQAFVKEQELYKLCSEYGNLSSLEVDKKLQQNMKKIDNRGVDEVLLELIGNALNEEYLPAKTKSTDINRAQADHTNKEERQRQDQRGRKRATRIPSDPTNHTHTKSKNLNDEDRKEKPSSELENRQRSDSQMSRLSAFGTATSGPTWLKKWFNSTDELHEEESHGPPSVLGNLIPSILKSNQEPAKPPMELNSFARENSDEEFVDDDYSPAATVIPQSNDFSVDKYGFYDSHNLRKVRKSISVSSDDPQVVHTKSPNFYEEGVNNSSSEHEFGEFSILNKPAAFVGVATTDLSNANDIKSDDKKVLAKVDIAGKSLTIHNNSIQKLKHLGELHDLGNLEMERQWDQYIRTLEMNFHKSNHLFGVRGLNLVDGKDDPREYYNNNKLYRQLHDLVDKGGIPQKYRGSIWMELTGGDNLRVNGEFERYYQLSVDPDADKLILSNLNQVDLDLHRTMPSNIFFNNMISNKPGPLYSKLKKILYAFVSYKPEIGYCQGMNKIVGNLLLGCPNLPEEDVYWIFVGLVEEILPRFKSSKLNYFDFQSLESIRQDQKIICDIYFPKFMPKLYQHLIENLGVQVEFITINWWLLLFTENFLTLDVWFKIFDNLLLSMVPETKLIALSLAVFKMFESILFDIDNADDVYLIMKNLNHNSLSKMNLKYSELIHTSDKFEHRIDAKQLNTYRDAYTTH